MSKSYEKTPLSLSRNHPLNKKDIMPITLKKGFTLLEILLVIGIIAVLAGIVIMAINPSRQLAQVRNTQRRLNINEIDKALKQYYIDNHSYPDTISTTLTEICNTGTATTSPNCDNLADLSFLVPTYLTAIPTDPQATSTTGYLVMRDNNNKVAILSSLAELQTTIATPQWTCGMLLIDNRDSQSYATVLIGSQCWMQENLNVGTMITGVTEQTNNSILEKYCYSDLESNCTTYGGLYLQDETMQYVTTPGAQGICPTGWHVPTHTEFTTLERTTCTALGNVNCDTTFPDDTTMGAFLGTNEGTELKSSSGSFKALMVGVRLPDASFFGLNQLTMWLSSQLEFSTGLNWIRGLVDEESFVARLPGPEGPGVSISVRCLKD